MKSYKVSVIIPVYNAAKYLDACITSVQNQTYKNIEIVLVDDGSSDDSAEICLKYASNDERILLIAQDNQGVSSARNHGLLYSTGEYVTFVDSDDELVPTAVELLLTDAENFRADIVSAVKCRVLQDGSISNPYEDNKCTVYKGLQALELSVGCDPQTNSACAKLFKKEFLNDIRFVEGKKVNEDVFFVFQCCAKQPLWVQHNVSLYKYFVRENSAATAAFSDKYLDTLYFCNRQKEIIEHRFPELKDKFKNREVLFHLLFLLLLFRTTEKKYKNQEHESICVVRQNYKYFVPNSIYEKIMALAVKFGLYRIVKLLVRFLWKLKGKI